MLFFPLTFFRINLFQHWLHELKFFTVILVALELVVVIHFAEGFAELVIFLIYEDKYMAFNFERPVY